MSGNKSSTETLKGDKPPRIKHNVTFTFLFRLTKMEGSPYMVNPKKNPLMGLEVTEGSQKKGPNGQGTFNCFRCCGGWKEPPWGKPFLVMAVEKTWLVVQGTGTLAESPGLLWDKAEQGKHLHLSFLPCCITCCPTPPHKVCLAKAFQCCEHVWKENHHHRSVSCLFRKRSETRAAKAGN